jgi:hypothetical protein
MDDQKHSNCVVENGSHNMTTRERTIDMTWKWRQLMLAKLHCDIKPDGLTSLVAYVDAYLCAKKNLVSSCQIVNMSRRPKGSEFVARPHRKRKKGVNSTSNFNRSSF